jgi:hypothetical protein
MQLYQPDQGTESSSSGVSFAYDMDEAELRTRYEQMRAELDAARAENARLRADLERVIAAVGGGPILQIEQLLARVAALHAVADAARDYRHAVQPGRSP